MFTLQDLNARRFLPAAQSVSVLLLSLSLISCGGDSNTPKYEAEDSVSEVEEEDTAGSTTVDQSGSEVTDQTDNSSIPIAGGSDSNSNKAPVVVVAPEDAQVALNTNFILNGNITFTGMPEAVPVVLWEKTSGPGQVLFADASASTSSVSFDQTGTYVLTLNATNGNKTAQDSVTITVYNDVVNEAPVISAGSDEAIVIDNVLTVSAEVTDDGLPNSTLSIAWSKVSGPAEVTFGSTEQAITTVSFSAAGTYVLRVSADDGELSSNDEMAITVSNAEAIDNNVDNVNADNIWQSVTTINGSAPQARHEAGGVAFQNKFYLMGGRGSRQVNRYSHASNSWENLGTPSMEMSHFQPVVYDGKIYVVGALDCCFPSESVISHIQIFDPATKSWSQGNEIPANRRRGSAGAVVYNNKIYLVGGTTNGHDGGMVNWFDEYNPETNQWKVLPNAPSARDHFSAALVGNKLVAAGGRQTDHPATFKNLVAAVDVYNFKTGQWEDGASIPTKRAGSFVVSYGSEAIIIGGEIDTGSAAVSVVEAYNVNTDSWRTLNSIGTARHSGGAAIISDAIHVVSGNLTTGGGNETTKHEKMDLD